jgi:hypothetical protein
MSEQPNHLLLILKSLTQNHKEKVRLYSIRTISSPFKIIIPTLHSASKTHLLITINMSINYGPAKLHNDNSSK